MEKLNTLDDINIVYNKTDKIENSISREKYSNFVTKIIKLENEIKTLKQENTELKANIGKEKEEEEINNRNNKSYETDEYKKFEEKFKKDEIKISDNNKKLINDNINNKKGITQDDFLDSNISNSNEINEEETDKITEQIEEENESIEKSSYSNKNNINNKNIKDKNKCSNNLEKQLERITKLYEELDKKLKKIKNEIKKIFTDVVIKEKEKEIKELFEICGFTEDEISEMLMYSESI